MTNEIMKENLNLEGANYPEGYFAMRPDLSYQEARPIRARNEYNVNPNLQMQEEEGKYSPITTKLAMEEENIESFQRNWVDDVVRFGLDKSNGGKK